MSRGKHLFNRKRFFNTPIVLNHGLNVSQVIRYQAKELLFYDPEGNNDRNVSGFFENVR